jgi:phage terminase large subunit
MGSHWLPTTVRGVRFAWGPNPSPPHLFRRSLVPVSEVAAPNTHHFPAKLQCLFQPKRYKVLYGGRGSGKSWGIARALLIKGAQAPLRVLCVREQQNSIADSVHQILSDQIAALGLGHLYNIQQKYIEGPDGTRFSFEGVRHNVQRIKSYEGVDILWAEEAQAITASSWNVLIPTIRKPGSEIWVSFNPNLETDATYKMFIKDEPTDAAVVEINWRDNPWFPEVLRLEMEKLKAKDYDAYLNVWEGKCRTLLEGAVYTEELRAAISEGRICKVPFQPEAGPVDVFFDLGWSDATALWFRQKVGFEWHYIHYYENRQQKLSHYLDYLTSKKWQYHTLWLPHDARAKEKGSGMSIEEQVRKTSWTVRIVRNVRLEDGINAARTILPNCYFDAEGCEKGLDALKHYRYEVVEENGTLSKLPKHDWSSHGADAFRYSAVALKQGRTERAERSVARSAKYQPQWESLGDTGHGWMR